MATSMRLFISGGPDLEPAREVLGRALAELPINVGWVIKRTPDVDAVAECHAFLLLLGADIVAPVGWELYWARRTEKPVVAFRQEVMRTPACHVFMQDNAGLDWHGFADYAALRRSAMRALGTFLLSEPQRYGLTIPEIVALQGHVQSLAQTPAPVAPGSPKVAGAGGGGVIFAPGKDLPPGTQIIGEE